MLILLQGLNLIINFLITSTWGYIMIREGTFSTYTKVLSVLPQTDGNPHLVFLLPTWCCCIRAQLSLHLLITVLLPYCHCKITLPLNVIQEFLEAVAPASKTTVLENPFFSVPVHWELSEIPSLWFLSHLQDSWVAPPGRCARATACSPFSSPETLRHFFDMAGLEGSKNNATSLVVCTYVAVPYTQQQQGTFLKQINKWLCLRQA